MVSIIPFVYLDVINIVEYLGKVVI